MEKLRKKIVRQHIQETVETIVSTNIENKLRSSTMAALPLDRSIIAKLFVPGVGGRAASVAGLTPEDDPRTVVGHTVGVASDGSTLLNASAWTWGEEVTANFNAETIYPALEGKGVRLQVVMKPEDLRFPRNSAGTDWFSGTDALARDEISITGTDKQAVDDMKKLQFVLKWSIHIVRSTKMCKLVLHSLPISIDRIEGISDPDAFTIATVPLHVISCGWANPPIPAMGVVGGLPTIQDLRSQETKDRGAVPESMLLKKFSRSFWTRCAKHPVLTKDQTKELIKDGAKQPIQGVPTVYDWPEVPPETEPQSEQPAAPPPTTGGRTMFKKFN